MDIDFTKLKDCSFLSFVEMEEEERDIYQRIGLMQSYSDKLLPEDKGIGDIDELPWGRVKECQLILSRNNLNYDDIVRALAVIYGGKKKKTIETIYQLKWYIVWKFYNFVVLQISELTKKESVNLGDTSLTDQEKDIVSVLNKYGHFATLEELTGGDLLEFKRWEKLKYNFVFTHLLYLKDKNDVQLALQKIRK